MSHYFILHHYGCDIITIIVYLYGPYSCCFQSVWLHLNRSSLGMFSSLKLHPSTCSYLHYFKWSTPPSLTLTLYTHSGNAAAVYSSLCCSDFYSSALLLYFSTSTLFQDFFPDSCTQRAQIHQSQTPCLWTNSVNKVDSDDNKMDLSFFHVGTLILMKCKHLNCPPGGAIYPEHSYTCRIWPADTRQELIETVADLKLLKFTEKYQSVTWIMYNL